MTRIRITHLPSLALVAVGLFLAASRVRRYVAYLSDPPSHRLGLLPELLLLGYLAVATLVIAIGVRGYRCERHVLSTTVLVGVVALAGTFAVDLYGVSANTQYVVFLGLTVSVIPALAVGAVLRRRDRQSARIE